jgi:aminoglycoside 6'-N-acetyltransferase I
LWPRRVGVDRRRQKRPQNNEVGVAPEYQRAGIGKRLLLALFALGRELGCREAWVATEHDNAAALGLYAAVGGESESCVICSFKLSEGGETATT